MRIHVCGVRGSTPAPGADFVRYGGHTSCLALSVVAGEAPTLVLDAGTGLRRVTGLLDGAPYLGPILLTHSHWDHVQGLPFFAGGDRDDAKVRLMLPTDNRSGPGPRAVLEKMMSPPHFPITPGQLRGEWTFSRVEPGIVAPEDLGPSAFCVEVREVPHKGGRTFGYRVSDGRSTLAYIPDHCPTTLGDGPDGWGEYHRAVLDLARGADLLVHDAHLVADELVAQASFGHAAAEYAVALGKEAGAKGVLLFHHAPDRTDEQIDNLLHRFTSTPIRVEAAAEGMVIDL